MFGSSKLNIENNFVDTTDITTGKQGGLAAVYFNQTQCFDLKANFTGSVYIKGNVATGSNADQNVHMFTGILAEGTNNNVNTMFYTSEGTKIDGTKTRIQSVGFTANKGIGLVFRNWTAERVEGWTDTLHREVFPASDAMFNGLNPVLKDNNVELSIDEHVCIKV